MDQQDALLFFVEIQERYVQAFSEKQELIQTAYILNVVNVNIL